MTGTEQSLPRSARRSRGQVMFLVLLGIMLLAGLIIYVMNVGDLVSRRVEMQNAADSAAISGASWMARSMNLLGMNNVAQTRMLALVPVLDSFPLATKMAHEEVAAWTECLERQLQRGIGDSYLREGVESLRDRMAKQRNILAPMDQLFNYSSFRMEDLTTWALRGHAGAPPHGELWQAAQSLDEFSQATACSAGVLGQLNANRFGELNSAEMAFVVPVLPVVPFRERDLSSYMEFERPVKRGRIPDHLYPQRLGPYDRLFKWRDYRYRDVRERDRLVDGTPGHGPIRGGGGAIGTGPRTRGRSARGHTTNPNPHWTYRTIGRVLLGYTVYGPYEWMMRRVHGYAQGHWHNRGYYPGELSDTFFHEYMRKIGGIKLGYMWGPHTPRYIHYPQWIVDYPRARAIAAQAAGGRAGAPRITRTMFYVVEIRSKYPKDHPSFRSPGTYYPPHKPGDDRNGLIATWYPGWEDPEEWEESPTVKRIGEWIWEEQYWYETTEDWDIDIRMRRDAGGEPVWQKVYMIAQYVFGGIDVGGEVEVTNPANFSGIEDLPAPILVDTSLGDYDMERPHHDQAGVRRDFYTYLGIASQKDTAHSWPKKFKSSNPFGGVCAVSQAEVFNTTSWDYWTQDWKAKLVATSKWTEWMERLEQGTHDAATADGPIRPEDVQLVDEHFAEDVQNVHRYLSGFDEQMVNQSLHH